MTDSNSGSYEPEVEYRPLEFKRHSGRRGAITNNELYAFQVKANERIEGLTKLANRYRKRYLDHVVNESNSFDALKLMMIADGNNVDTWLARLRKDPTAPYPGLEAAQAMAAVDLKLEFHRGLSQYIDLAHQIYVQTLRHCVLREFGQHRDDGLMFKCSLDCDVEIHYTPRTAEVVIRQSDGDWCKLQYKGEKFDNTAKAVLKNLRQEFLRRDHEEAAELIGDTSTHHEPETTTGTTVPGLSMSQVAALLLEIQAKSTTT